MCWQLAVAAAISAAGSMAQHRAQQRALTEQMRLTAQQQALQKQYADEATNAALAEVEQYREEPREAEQQRVQQTLEAKLTAPYTTGEYAGPQAPRYAGMQTESHVRDTALATERVLSEAFNRAKLQAKLLTPAYLRTGESYRLADTASDIGVLGRFSQGSAAAAAPGIKAAGVPSGSAMALGSGLQGLGQGMAMSSLFSPVAGGGSFSNYTPSPQFTGGAYVPPVPYSPSSLFSSYVPLR